jgi:polysaccharide deacetylase 2 family uncharacterized protein YibQ
MKPRSMGALKGIDPTPPPRLGRKVLTILGEPAGTMAWNNDEFADMLHRACRPGPSALPSARPRPPLVPAPVVRPAPHDRAQVRALQEPVASANAGYGLAALLILGGAIWLTLPHSQRQASVAESSPAAAAPSQIVGQLTLPVLPDAAGPTAGEPSATTAPGPVGAAEAPPAPAAKTGRIDPQSRRLAALDRARPHQPPPASAAAPKLAPPAEPAAEPKLATPAEPPPAVEPKLAALAPPPQARQEEPAWLRFAVPAAPAEGRPRIAVVIDDLGLDKKRTERATVLPGPVTLSFLAYATDLPKLTEAARHAGHELLVSVPMEPISHADEMGPNGLMVGLAHDELLRRLRWNLDRFTGYVGINNHMGSRFTHDAANMAPVMEELRARGLLFLDARTVGNSTGVDVARRIGVPQAGRDVFLDNEVTPGAIAAQLAEVERVARRQGSAIAIGHARDGTLELLNAWLASLPGKGLALVPVSAIVREHWHGGGGEATLREKSSGLP